MLRVNDPDSWRQLSIILSRVSPSKSALRASVPVVRPSSCGLAARQAWQAQLERHVTSTSRTQASSAHRACSSASPLRHRKLCTTMETTGQPDDARCFQQNQSLTRVLVSHQRQAIRREQLLLAFHVKSLHLPLPFVLSRVQTSPSSDVHHDPSQALLR